MKKYQIGPFEVQQLVYESLDKESCFEILHVDEEVSDIEIKILGKKFIVRIIEI